MENQSEGSGMSRGEQRIVEMKKTLIGQARGGDDMAKNTLGEMGVSWQEVPEQKKNDTKIEDVDLNKKEDLGVNIERSLDKDNELIDLLDLDIPLTNPAEDQKVDESANQDVVQEPEKILDMATPEEAVEILTEDEENSKRKDRDETVEKLNLILQEVPDDVKSNKDELQKYRKNIDGLKRDLKTEKGIDINAYIFKDIDLDKDREKGLDEIGIRKRLLKEILVKGQQGEDLADDEKKILETVNIKIEDFVVNNEERQVEPGDNPIVNVELENENPIEDEGDEVIIEEVREVPKTDADRRIETINGYRTNTLKRQALEKYRELLINRAALNSEIEKVEGAIENIKRDVENEIQEYADRGEMRPEVQAATQKYYVDLERKYSAGGSLLNYYNMTPDAELMRSLAEMKELGSDGEKISTDLEKELFAIGTLHDLTNKINTRGSVDQDMLNYASLLKGEQFDKLIHLEDKLSVGENDADGGKDYVIRCLAAIDKEARETYTERTGTKVFKLEDPDLENRVILEAKGKSLYFKIARDLYRTTGGEARYGVAGLAHNDAEKGNLLVIERNKDENNGAFLRKALNIRREIAGTVDPAPEGRFAYRTNQVLWKHLDPGISSFWEEVWKKVDKNESVGDDVKDGFETQNETALLGSQDASAGISQREYAVLDVEALRSLSFGTERPGGVDLGNEIAFNVWLDNVGKVATGMSNEAKFMAKPSFNSFKTFFGDDYKGVFPKNREGGRKLNREEYLEERLGDFVTHLRTNTNFPPTKIAEALREYTVADFVFKSGNQLDRFMEEHKIPKGGAGDVISNVINLKDNLKSSDPVEKRNAQKKALGLVGIFLKLLGSLVKDAGK